MDNYRRLDRQQLAAALYDLLEFGSTFVSSKVAALQILGTLAIPATTKQDDRGRWHVKLVNQEAE